MVHIHACTWYVRRHQFSLARHTVRGKAYVLDLLQYACMARESKHQCSL